MLDYLKRVFGDTITLEEYPYPDHAPAFFRADYTMSKIVWKHNECVLLAPKNPQWRLPALKKQLQIFQTLCEHPCALSLQSLTALQRQNLLENNIPFVAGFQQVYLPFWGCAFAEKFRLQTPMADKMAPGTQLVFLYLYYQESGSKINLTHIAEALNLSKATCNRALQDLEASGLVTLAAQGRIKWVNLAGTKEEFLQKGYGRLRTPVDRLLYLKTPLAEGENPRSGLQALSELSMIAANQLDSGIAVFKKVVGYIPASNVISRREFEDFGGYAVEVWSYDPGVLAKDGRVDDISLLLSLADSKNERVQMALDVLREKHKLPIQTEE